MLRSLHQAHARQEQAGLAEAEALLQARAEAAPIQRLLGALGGLQQEMDRYTNR